MMRLFRFVFRRIIRSKLMVAAILLAAGGVGIYFWVRFATAIELDQAKLEAARLDPMWRLGFLMQDRVLTNENSALVLAPILGYVPLSWPFTTRIRPAPQDAPPGSPPLSGEDIADRIDRVPLYERFDAQLAGDIRDAIFPYAPHLEEVRAIKGMDQGRYSLLMATNPIATLLPHVQRIRNLGRLMTIEARLEAQDGEIDRALESCLLAVNVGRSIGDEPTLISQLVRLAVVSEALATVERVLAQGEASDQALSEAQAVFFAEAQSSQQIMGLRGERALIDDMYAKMEEGAIRVGEVSSLLENKTPAAMGVVGGMPFLHHNHALVLKALNEAVEIARRPDHEQPALWEKWTKGVEPPTSLLTQLATSLTFETLSANPKAMSLGFIRRRTEFRAMVILLAAERHRLRHGQLPVTIAEIDLDLVSFPAIDLLSRTPFRLLREGDGIAIYSVGFDGEDNHAHFDSKKGQEKGYDLGFRLRDPSRRATPAARSPLPDRVFVRQVDEDTSPSP